MNKIYTKKIEMCNDCPNELSTSSEACFRGEFFQPICCYNKKIINDTRTTPDWCPLPDYKKPQPSEESEL